MIVRVMRDLKLKFDDEFKKRNLKDYILGMK